MPSTYTIEQRQYKTYILANSESKVEIVPERGGIVTSWKVDDQEVFYLDTERFTHPDLSVRGGIPILFPICGNLPENTYTHNGETYSLKQHGFARESAWIVEDQPDQEPNSITLILTSNSQTLAVYPFDFQVVFTYKLEGNKLSILQTYTNHSDEPMPFSTGTHAYFAAPDKSQLQFKLPGTEYVDQKTFVTHPFDGNFDFDREEIDVMFSNLSGDQAIALDPSRNLQTTIEWDDHHAVLVFWTVKGKDFYCIEPWTAARNAMNTGTNLITLEPGASLDLKISMTVEIK